MTPNRKIYNILPSNKKPTIHLVGYTIGSASFRECPLI